MAYSKRKGQDGYRKPDDSISEKVSSVIAAEWPKVIGQDSDTLSEDRDELKRRYLGEPYPVDGKRKADGLSVFRDRSVMETVEWALPGLMRVFSGQDDIVRFDPTGPDDEQFADDATAYVNALFAKSSFKLTHDTLKEGLYQRVGWAKAWWEQREEERSDEYEGLSIEEAVEVLAGLGPDAEGAKVDLEEEEDGTYCLKIEHTKETKRVCIEPVPSSHVVYSFDARCIEDARFVAQWELRSATELIEEGYPRDLVMSLPFEEDIEGDYPEDQTQDRVNYAAGSTGADTGDESTRLIKVWEAYLRCDVDDDGMAERLRVVFAGDKPSEGVTVIECEPWSMCRAPLFPACSVPLPHAVVGLCLADLVIDVQDLKTELYRQFLDGLAFANTGEVIANEGASGSIDYDSLLARGPGKVHRTKGDASIAPLQVMATGREALEGLMMADKARETRTGIGGQMQGMQADALQGSATGAAIVEDQVNQRIELIARIYAEMFYKPLAKYVLQLVCKYQNKEDQIRLRGRYMALNPARWNPEWDVSVAVGLGTGNRAKVVQGLQTIIQSQVASYQQLGPQGPVKLSHIMRAHHKLAQALGFENPEQFFGTVEDAQRFEEQAAQQPPKPSPDEQLIAMEERKAQARIQIDAAKARNQQQLAERRAAADIALEREKMQANLALKRDEMQLEAHLDATQMGLDAALTGAKAQPSATNIRGKVV